MLVLTARSGSGSFCQSTLMTQPPLPELPIGSWFPFGLRLQTGRYPCKLGLQPSCWQGSSSPCSLQEQCHTQSRQDTTILHVGCCQGEECAGSNMSVTAMPPSTGAGCVVPVWAEPGWVPCSPSPADIPGHSRPDCCSKPQRRSITTSRTRAEGHSDLQSPATSTECESEEQE